MSRLQEELQKRQQAEPSYTDAEAEIRRRYEARKASLQKLQANKDFQEYLQLEAEMNDPKIVIAHVCHDPVCESLKKKIRDYWQRQRLLEKVQERDGPRPRPQSHRASR